MTLLDAIIIYLAAGAPFGVLIFLSRQSGGNGRALAVGTLAVVLWPVLAAWRSAAAFSKRFNTHEFVEPPRADSNGNEASLVTCGLERLTKSQGEVVERYLALSGLADRIPEGPAELFEIAGHPNPMVATVCNARRRNAVVLKHLADASASLDRMLSRVDRHAGLESGLANPSEFEVAESLYESLAA